MVSTHDGAVAELSRLHTRLCPRQVLGVRIGRHAGYPLGVGVPRTDKRMIVIVELDGCFADGAFVATGCWFGRRTLRLVDHGRVAATFVDLATRAAVRIWPAARARAAAQHFVPDAPDAWHAQLEAYRTMPAAKLLASSRVRVDAWLADSSTLTPSRSPAVSATRRS